MLASTETGLLYMIEKKNHNKEIHSSEYKKLSIQVGLNGLSFSITDTISNTILSCETVVFEKKLTPFQLKKKLVEVFEAYKIPQDTFSEVEIIHKNNLFNLVPKALFNKDELGNYLKYNAKLLANDDMVFDDIENHDIINVYVPFTNINNYVYELFGEFYYKHHGTVLIQALLNNQENNNNPVCYVHMAEKQLDIVILSQKKLLLYNNFSYETQEDFMYYLLFTLEQLNLNTEDIKLRLFGAIEDGDNLFKLCKKYIKNIAIFAPDNIPHLYQNQDINSIDFSELNTL